MFHVKKKSTTECLNIVDPQRYMPNRRLYHLHFPAFFKAVLCLHLFKDRPDVICFIKYRFSFRTWIDSVLLGNAEFFVLFYFLRWENRLWERRKGGRWRILSVIVLIPGRGLSHLAGLPHFPLPPPLPWVFPLCFKTPTSSVSLCFVCHS